MGIDAEFRARFTVAPSADALEALIDRFHAAFRDDTGDGCRFPSAHWTGNDYGHAKPPELVVSCIERLYDEDYPRGLTRVPRRGARGSRSRTGWPLHPAG
jgi:hypothetical protein